jgi:hypothetical protein
MAKSQHDFAVIVPLLQQQDASVAVFVFRSHPPFLPQSAIPTIRSNANEGLVLLLLLLITLITKPVYQADEIKSAIIIIVFFLFSLAVRSRAACTKSPSGVHQS